MVTVSDPKAAFLTQIARDCFSQLYPRENGCRPCLTQLVPGVVGYVSPWESARMERRCVYV